MEYVYLRMYGGVLLLLQDLLIQLLKPDSC